MDTLQEFRKLGLSDNIIKTLKEKGFEIPSPIQERIIPKIFAGETDLIGQAQTGTGKTAAFGLPVLDMINEKSKKVQVLILVPTRELAMQISEELNSFRGNKRIHIVPIYGGQSIEQQLKKLAMGIDVVVGTPGRIVDLIKRRALALDTISYLILDEADEILKMGFQDEVDEILKHTNPQKRTLMFCATMPREIQNLIKKYMKDYELVRIDNKQQTTDLTDQIYFEVEESNKLESLCRIIDFENDFYGLVFCRTKVDVDKITSRLIDRGYDADCIHGDITQLQREKVLAKFKNKKLNILVATDVAARGIDIQNLTHVINYSLPQDAESYVHRIGRTGRAGNEGTALTFVTRKENRYLMQIQKVSKSSIRKGKLPAIGEIIDAKKQWIKKELGDQMSKDIDKIYLTLAKDLMIETDPRKLIAALLKMSYQNELDASNYREIKESYAEISGPTRLSIAMGKRDGMTKRSIVELIKDKAKTYDKKINDVQVFDSYSLITVPFEEAEIILNAFRKNKAGKRPVIEKHVPDHR